MKRVRLQVGDYGRFLCSQLCCGLTFRHSHSVIGLVMTGLLADLFVDGIHDL